VNQEKTNAEEHRDDTGAKIGMWLFLFTEILLFGGMFLLYSVYRSKNPLDFHQAAFELSTVAGTINTLILITSSLTMALSISAIQKGDKKLSKAFLIMTIIFGLLFLVIKYFEWGAKFQHGIYPNSPELLDREQGEILFFSLYFIMTGLHGLHVLIGIFLLSFMLFFMVRETIGQNDFIKLENSGLYWHLVDIVWIFLFPLFYLVT
jgi:cytochrome c oxidase subunit III